ncbi:MAG: putrescine-ornithine antiporter [Treponema sp.]|nr:putrescine-ornithine antiporter [Treponema sp.]
MEKKKKMSVVHLTIITAINMMGSGIIMLPANLAQVGTMSVLSWLVTAVGAAFLAYSFSRAGMYSRNSGGMGGYAQYSFGKAGAFMANYTYGVSLLIANVAIAVSTVGYASALFNIQQSEIGIALSTIFVLWLASVLNFGGAHFTGRLSTVTVWGIIIPLITICVAGWFFFNPSHYVQAWNPHNYSVFTGIGNSIAITLWAFLGLESASADMDAVENPRKNVPIAVISGTLIAAVLYIISTNVIQGIVPNADLANSSAPFGLAFSRMFNPVIGDIVIALMVLSCFGSLLGWQFTIAEVFRSSAQEGYFPKFFNKILDNGTPLRGIVIITAVQSLLALMTISPSLSKQFNLLVDLAVVTNAIPYVLSMAALNTIQTADGTVAKGAKTFTNVIALLAGIYTLYAIYNSGATAVLYGSLVTFLGWTLYGFISSRFDLPKLGNQAGNGAKA